MRLLITLAIVYGLSGCAAVSKFKIESDGTYRFKTQPFVVWAPDKCLLDIAVRDTDRSVDFTTGAGYWMASGLYSVQVFAFNDMSVDDQHPFQERIKDVAPQFMTHDRSKAFKFVYRDGKSLDIGGRPAYQATAVEEGKATFVATFVLQNSHITVASLIFPIENSGSQIDRDFPWDCYNRFVASVKEVH